VLVVELHPRELKHSLVLACMRNESDPELKMGWIKVWSHKGLAHKQGLTLRNLKMKVRSKLRILEYLLNELTRYPCLYSVGQCYGNGYLAQHE
jgi:hypothetical protein